MRTLWGKDSSGRDVYLYSIKNVNGMEAAITSYGARVTQLRVPSRKCGAIDTVLGYSRLAQYLNDDCWLGAVCGRSCNRIAKSRFVLQGQTHYLQANEGENHLHGGAMGFSHRVWECVEHSQARIVLRLISEDADQGYPGKLDVQVTYEITDDNQFVFSWTASSDAATVVNLTNHSYFNLAGFGDIKNHQLKIPCEYYTPTSSSGIPDGTIEPVAGTSLDLTSAKVIGSFLSPLASDLEPYAGLDHNWAHNNVHSQTDEKILKPFAELCCEETALKLTVHSNLPGMQCYTGNHVGISGVFGVYEGICLETQFFPDSPNNENFPSSALKKGESVSYETHYCFTDIADF